MDTQNFKRHAQYVPGFHFITLEVILAALVIVVIMIITSGFSLLTIFSILVAASLGLLFVYTRQFATGNQDRMIREEENFRSFRITGRILDRRLKRSQVIALRFAGDDEYADLAEKAVNENLSGKDIKQAIQTWRADHHRV